MITERRVYDHRVKGGRFAIEKKLAMSFQAGDYVFLKPKSAAESYYIARVLRVKEDQVQVNWFYRVRDLRGRGDSRELIASMDCDWNSINSVLQKVTVNHICKIKDLKEFKAQDLCFYYDKLYDKYTRRMYQVVPLWQINNLPKQYKDLIKSEYLLIEEKSQKKFTQRRNCALCFMWVNPTESNVVCTNCRRGYHLGCVGLKKELPKKGYGWVCGLCSSNKYQKEDDDECSDLTEFEDLEDEEDFVQKEEEPVKKLQKNEEVEIWPWRYFGDYSRLEDLLNDPEGRPKSGSRIGNSFQAVDLPKPLEKGSTKEIANVVTLEHKKDPFLQDVHLNKSRGRGRPRKSETQELEVKKIQGKKKKMEAHELLIPHRGENEVVFSPKDISVQDLNAYVDRIHSHYKLSNVNADLVQISLSNLHSFKYNADDAFKHLTVKNLNELLMDQWGSEDAVLFEKCFVEYGEDLLRFKLLLPHKNMKEIVSFFYKWKNTPRFISVFNQYTSKRRAKKKSEDLKVVQKLSDLNSEGSSESETESVSESPLEGVHCGVCKVKKSQKWKIRHIPKRAFVCADCDVYWMKYGDIGKKIEVESSRKEYVKSEELPLVHTADKTPVKSEPLVLQDDQDVNQAHQTLKIESTPKEPPETDDEFKGRPCTVCGDNSSGDPNNAMLVCVDCTLKVHRICHGAGLNDDDFRCERCVNIKAPESSTIHSCVLCPTAAPAKVSALKKTIGNNWVHLVCAIWIPEIKFGDTAMMNSVECMGHIDPQKWRANRCTICNSSEGVAVQCCERKCSTFVHVSCALLDPEYLIMIGSMPGSDLAFEPLVFCNIHCRKWKHKIPTDISQSQMVKQYVLEHKKVPAELYTTGEKRAYSALLNDTCECHVSATIKIPKTRKVNHAILQSAVENRLRKTCNTCLNDVSCFWWPIDPSFDADGREDNNVQLYECQKCNWERNHCDASR